MSTVSVMVDTIGPERSHQAINDRDPGRFVVNVKGGD